MLSPRTLGLWAALIAASALISYGLVRAQFPAALLLGPMIGAIAFGVGGSRLRVPRAAFQASQAAIGCLVAHAVTGQPARHEHHVALEAGDAVAAVRERIDRELEHVAAAGSSESGR